MQSRSHSPPQLMKISDLATGKISTQLFHHDRHLNNHNFILDTT